MTERKTSELMTPRFLLCVHVMFQRSWSEGRGSYLLTVNEKNEKESISNISQLLVEAETNIDWSVCFALPLCYEFIIAGNCVGNLF